VARSSHRLPTVGQAELDPFPDLKETFMRTLIMLAIGVPLPIIALYWLFG